MKRTIKMVLLLILGVTYINANDSFSYRETGSGLLLLSDNENISMIYEDLEYDYKNRSYKIIYTFQNKTNQDQNISVAFPISSEGFTGFEIERFDTAEEWMKGTYHFTTEIEGVSYQRELIKLDSQSATEDYDYAFVLDISIPKNDKITIIDRYGSKGTSSYFYDFFRPSSNDFTTQIFFTDISHKYILETANSWSGSINDFHTAYRLGYYNNFISVNNSIYFFNNNQFQSLEFKSNYSEMSIEYDKGSDGSDIYLKMDFIDFSPEKNLETELKIRQTNSLNAAIFAGTIFGYVEKNEYRKEHIYYLLDMIDKIFTQENFEEILYKAIIKLDYYYSDEDLRSTYLSKSDKYIGRELVTLSRFYLNIKFAQSGYIFSTQNWTNIFNYYNWYEPKTKNVEFSHDEILKIDQIKSIRSKYNDLANNEMSSNFSMPSLELEYQGK